VRTRSVTETAIVSASILLALLVVVVGATRVPGNSPGIIAIFSVTILAALGMFTWSRRNSAAVRTPTELTSGEEYRRLAEECRRLAEMAITAQEHTDLRLGEVSVQMDEMRAQLDSVRRILTDVE